MKQLSRKEQTRSSGSLPLVRLSLLLPFVEALDELGVDADKLLMSSGLVRDTVRNPEIFVPVMVVHRFLEDAARSAEDPYFGMHVGEQLDLASWSPFVDAVTRAATLGEFLIRFIQAARAEASSAYHFLEIGAIDTSFREIRTSEQEIAPAQNDAFTAAYSLCVLQAGAGSDWNAKRIHLTICEPDALPDQYLGVNITAGDRMGMVVRFPTQWLLRKLNQHAMIEGASNGGKRLQVPRTFLNALRQILLLHLEEPELNVDLVAELAGMSRQSLQRKLKADGTTLTKEVIQLKKQRAAEYLIKTDKTVTEIATALGFTKATSFTRAFNSWAGESPREFRKKRQSK